MPRFEFEGAVTLAACSLASGLIFILNRPKEGKIELPTHTEDVVPNGSEAEIPDPFDVATPEDWIEGYPLEEEKFWKYARRRKAALCALATGILILQAVRLGLTIEDGQTNQKVLATNVLYLYYSLFLLVVSVRSLKHSTVESHTESILHITALTTLPSLLLGTFTILPNTPPFSELDLRVSFLTDRLWYATIALYILSCIIAFTTRLGPPLHFPPSAMYLPKTVEAITNQDKENVTGTAGASPWEYLLFSYSTKVVMLGNDAESLEIGDLPIVPNEMRSVMNFKLMRKTLKDFKLRIFSWSAKTGSGWSVAYQLCRLNIRALVMQFWITVCSALMFYSPPFFLQLLVKYLENDPERRDRGWGWVYVFGIIMTNLITYLLTAQLWSISTTVLQTRFRIQLNSLLYAKTLVRKDAASATSTKKDEEGTDASEKKDDEDEFSTKAQIMTLMTTDTDRVSEFAWHIFTLVDSPIEMTIGAVFVYNLLGVSSLYGLLVILLSLPLNHFAGKVVVGAQENLMKSRDERIALMNEILGAIRMLKFMAWERSFESRVLKIRARELKYQKLNYTIETCWNGIWNATPILVALVSFFHFTVIRGEELTPSIAFTSIAVFNELKFALNALPETLINVLQSLVSLRRIEKYLNTPEVTPVLPLDQQSQTIAFQSCTITWPQDRSQSSAAPSAVSTPRQKFILVDLSLKFPQGELSLICGKLGSGKTLLLLSLLGEADVLAGQILCPRSPPNAITTYSQIPPGEKWVVQGLCAYVPQTAWLRNASIKDNILFNLPYDEKRYQKTLEVCALVTDMEILEDGDESEIGERGVNLSGGQKARVSLARAVYSRASILFLDDVLSAVDAHTAHHLFFECLKGELMKDRTIVLVSHHVQLCAPGASYIVALDNGRVQFQGDHAAFQKSGVIRSLVQSSVEDLGDEKDKEEAVESKIERIDGSDPQSETTTVANVPTMSKVDKKPARKLVEEETRAIGRVRKDVWMTYFRACGAYWYWILFFMTFIFAALSPVAENGWLKVWSGSVFDGSQSREAIFYVTIYALVTVIGLIITTIRWFVLYNGSIHASSVLYKRLLETVLFANIRFHDTVNRGRLLNRFGKDFEGIDSSLSDNFGRTVMYGLSSVTTLVTVSFVGGFPFIIAAGLLGIVYYNVGKVYGQTSRDMRRLDSVTRSPIYSIYGETISGVTILRAFGASSKFLRDMLRCLDTNVNPYYWMWGVNRWLSIRFNLLSCGIVGAMAAVAVANPNIGASIAGFSLAFASTITNDLLFMVRRFVGLEQSMVALERVKEYSDLKREPPEFVEPRPPASWPTNGAIRCENLVIRYAPELPDVLHRLNFEIRPGEKVGILGRTGSGKSTLALSFFRFVEATEGRILVDDIDIAKIGLTDLRSRLTIIPQDPTILSGTLRSTLDVFDEYEDAEIFEALRRVHLIPSSDDPEESEGINVNIFRNLESPVSEGGENFSTGEKQLLCMARAILKRSKVLVMDEATASVDYATDELISKTIRQEFADSTILTIAHRLRTVIDYDRIMLLDQGRIVEFDQPKVLLSRPNSRFYALCKATGKEEFSMLRKLAGV
ncbi:atp-binding cassette transporter [Moniliophthora roreri MCA 2997]|uniref:Atp-binding cassette transporter n=1 Tax=Moniliophthora roreri (strain MCA 2997) TaxID=1381753 RepID=V2WM38_MONRO|nr:atp-binding cassette transporter [Moniliophthora roreri MCA 2997]